MSNGAGPVLVVGIPRSGTTWTGNTLSRAAGLPLIHEPDNEKEYLSALLAKRGLGRFPALRPGDPAPLYERVWRSAFVGLSADTATRRWRAAGRLWSGVEAVHRERAVLGHPSRRARTAMAVAGPIPTVQSSAAAVVKSVHVPLSLDWLTDRFPTVRVVVVLRHPANVLSSWREMRLPDQDRALDRQPAVRRTYLTPWHVSPPSTNATPLFRAAWQVCLLTAVLLDAVSRRPEWSVVYHEELCVDPVRRFTALAGGLGMPGSDEVERYLRESDRPGTGFTVERRADEQSDRWRTRLGPDGINALSAAVTAFPGLDRWADDLHGAARRPQG